MADDMMAALLPALISGGGSGGGGMNPDAMGALEAMQASPFAQGVPSQSGPAGQIIQALMPMLAGPVYAQQARQQQQDHQRDTLVHVLTLVKQMKGVDLEDKRLQQEAEALGVKKENMKHFAQLFDAVHKDPEAMKNVRMNLNSQGEASLSMGGGSGKESELDLVKRLVGGDASAQPILDALAKQKQSELAGNAMAKIPAAVEEARQKQAIKKPLAPEKLAEYSGAVTSLDQLDKTIASFNNKEVTRKDVATATLTHGLLSHPTLRQYAGFYNDVAQGRYKSRLTAAEIERLSQELPPPSAYALDPDQFVQSLNVARRHLADSTSKRMEYQSKNYDIPPEIAADVGRLTAPPAMPAHQIPSNIDIDVPPEFASQAKQLFDGQIAAGHDATTAARAVQSWLASQPKP